MSETPDPPLPAPDEALDPAEALLERWQGEGDVEALDALLRREILVLKRLLNRRGASWMGPALGATDVAHEAVLALLRVREPPQFPSAKALRSYLWKSAWRLLLQQVRKPGARPLRLDDTRGAGAEELPQTTGGMGKALDSDRGMALDLIMSLLKPDDREILSLVYFQELDVAQAGAKLGIGKDAANMRLVRARRRLAEKLASWAELIG